MVNNKIKIGLRIGLSCIFVGYLVFKIDWNNLFAIFDKLHINLYAASTLIALITSFFMAYKYHLLIKKTSLNLPIISLIKINFISIYYAIFLPSALGIEVVRWYKITRNQNGRVLFLAVTMFERLTYLFILFCFSVIPLYGYAPASNVAFLRIKILPLVILFAILLFLGLAYFFSSKFKCYVERFVIVIFKKTKNKDRAISFLNKFNLPNQNYSQYLSVSLVSIIVQLLFLSRIYFLFQAMSIPLGALNVFWMGSLVLLLQVLPISFAGIGIREGAYAYLFSLFEILRRARSDSRHVVFFLK